MTYIPPGPAPSSPAELERFWRAARAACAGKGLRDDYQVRWIGLDDETTRQIFELIDAGDKTGTFTLPWIVARTDQPEPRVGDCIVLIGFDGKPTMLIRLTEIEEVRFGDITAEHTAVDGTPVRPLDVWKPLHTQYWNNLLAPFALSVSDEMPVLIEKFELLYSRGRGD